MSIKLVSSLKKNSAIEPENFLRAWQQMKTVGTFIPTELEIKDLQAHIMYFICMRGPIFYAANAKK
jgi:hypothetical protein